jgi:hypothetical protein
MPLAWLKKRPRPKKTEESGNFDLIDLAAKRADAL